MNKQQIAQLLTVASGFDRRVVDPVTVEAWALIPEICSADYDDAVQAVVDHQTGPRRGEYLTVAHIVDALRVVSRNVGAALEADVRSAKARGLVPKSHGDREPLPEHVREALFTARETERRAAASRFEFDQLEDMPIDPGEVGRTA